MDLSMNINKIHAKPCRWIPEVVVSSQQAGFHRFVAKIALFIQHYKIDRYIVITLRGEDSSIHSRLVFQN